MKMTNNDQNENIGGLFSDAGEPQTADEFQVNLQKMEEYFSNYPVEGLDAEVVSAIKKNIDSALLRKRPIDYRRVFLKAVAVAAVFMLVSILLVRFGEKPHGPMEKVLTAGIIPSSIWEADDISTADSELAMLSDELDELERQSLSIGLGESENDSIDLTELEIELSEIDNDFWKG